MGFYRRFGKRALDILLCGAGLAVLSPVFAALALLVRLDSPGPVFFAQKRIGKDHKTFQLYKFRSMRVDTPHDVPTHLLGDPTAYLTSIGKFLRKTSLDELPQLLNILRGELSWPTPGAVEPGGSDCPARSERRQRRAAWVDRPCPGERPG